MAEFRAQLAVVRSTPQKTVVTFEAGKLQVDWLVERLGQELDIVLYEPGPPGPVPPLPLEAAIEQAYNGHADTEGEPIASPRRRGRRPEVTDDA